jgi:hypothetical protein
MSDFLRGVPVVAHDKYQTASQLPNTFSYGKIVTSMTFTCVRHRKRGHNKASSFQGWGFSRLYNHTEMEDGTPQLVLVPA